MAQVTDQPPVRTFHARRGRRSQLTTDRLETLLPRYAVPPRLGARPAGVERVVLEIGCGHGAAAVAYAHAHPTHLLVALDVHPPGVARMLAAAADAGVDNLAAELGDAVEFLEQRVDAGALDAVHLFFPDPWLKARHHRRRFVSRHTLGLLATRLAPGGEVLVATDQLPYAAHVREVAAGEPGWVCEEVARPAWRPMAGFEAKGVAAGRAITELRLRYRADVERATRIELA
ncbi:MAG: methyltransferase [Actinomycetales bacterium]|nr:methyltransferase [Actinomycetales bacterium]